MALNNLRHFDGSRHVVTFSLAASYCKDGASVFMAQCCTGILGYMCLRSDTLSVWESIKKNVLLEKKSQERDIGH